MANILEKIDRIAGLLMVQGEVRVRSSSPAWFANSKTLRIQRWLCTMEHESNAAALAVTPSLLLDDKMFYVNSIITRHLHFQHTHSLSYLFATCHSLSCKYYVVSANRSLGDTAGRLGIHFPCCSTTIDTNERQVKQMMRQ